MNARQGALTAVIRGDYAWWLTASTSDMLGRSLRDIALPFIVVAITGSSAVSGMVQTVGGLVYLSVMMFGGVLVDRIDRRDGMIARAVTGMVLWLVIGALIVTDGLRLWMVIAIVVLAELSDGLFGTCDNAALRSIVPDDVVFANVQSINQGRNAAVSMVGGPAGGMLYAVAASLPYFASVAILGLMGVAGVRRDIAEAFAFLWRQPVLRSLAGVDLFLSVAFNGLSYAAMYALIDRNYSAVQVSMLDMSLAVGMLAGSAAAGWLVQHVRTGRLLSVVSMMTVIVTLAALLWHSYSALVAWFVLLGLAVPAYGSACMGYLYAVTPMRMQGRINSMMAMVELSATTVMPAVAGALVHAGKASVAYGVPVAAAVSAALLLLNNRTIGVLGTPDRWKGKPMPRGG